MNKTLLTLLIFSFFSVVSTAQHLGNTSGFEWLNTSKSAHACGLGDWHISEGNRDPSVLFFNPSAIDESTYSTIQVNHEFFSKGVTMSSLVAIRPMPKWDATVAGHVRYLNYGKFDQRSVDNTLEGSFSANGYAIGATVSRQLDDKVDIGATVSFLGSSIERYNSFGLGLDLGARYYLDSLKQTIISLQVNNVGSLVKRFGNESTSLPYESSIGISKRLKHIPLRFGVLYKDIDRWDIVYDDPARRKINSIDVSSSGEELGVIKFAKKFARHLAFNLEVSLGKRNLFQLRAGYDVRRQQEFAITNFRSISGFSYGLGVNLRRLKIDYGHSRYHTGGGINQFSLLWDFDPRSKN